MKNNILIDGAFVFVLSFIVTGCNNEEVVTDNSYNGVEINVSSTITDVNDVSRAILGTDGKTPVWEANDEIAVKVRDASAETLALTSGVGTSSGKFSGTITATEGTMNFYYPVSAANSIDLTSQDGDAKKMVMFGSCDYSTTPSISFKNKTSILKFNMTVPDGAGWTSSTDLRAIVCGVYSSGKFDVDGNITTDPIGSINVSKVIVNGENKISGYAVVIPGSAVKNLYIIVTDGTKEYKTKAYTSDKTIPENSVITINKELINTVIINNSEFFIGMQSSIKNYGPYLNGITGEVYTISEGAEKCRDIDMAMIYSYNPSTTGVLICSAAANNMSYIYGVESNVTDMGGDTADVWSNWSKRKSTTMKKLSMTNEEFSAISSNEEIVDSYNNATTDEVNVLYMLAAGDVIAYKTEEGIYGLIYINGKKMASNKQSHNSVDIKIIQN